MSVRIAGRRLRPCPGTHSVSASSHSVCPARKTPATRVLISLLLQSSPHSLPRWPLRKVCPAAALCSPHRSVQRPPVAHFPVRVGITYARADLYAAPYGHTQLGMKYPFPATPALRELRSPNLLIPFPGFE